MKHDLWDLISALGVSEECLVWKSSSIFLYFLWHFRLFSSSKQRVWSWATKLRMNCHKLQSTQFLMMWVQLFSTRQHMHLYYCCLIFFNKKWHIACFIYLVLFIQNYRYIWKNCTYAIMFYYNHPRWVSPALNSKRTCNFCIHTPKTSHIWYSFCC